MLKNFIHGPLASSREYIIQCIFLFCSDAVFVLMLGMLTFCGIELSLHLLPLALGQFVSLVLERRRQ